MINAQIQARLNHKISKPLASTDKNASHPNLHHGRPALPADAFCRCTRSEFYNPRDPRDGVLPWQVVPSGLGWLDHSVRAVLCRPSELDMDGSWVFIHSQESYPWDNSSEFTASRISPSGSPILTLSPNVMVGMSSWIQVEPVEPVEPGSK